jgi:hypothetical protein
MPERTVSAVRNTILALTLSALVPACTRGNETRQERVAEGTTDEATLLQAYAAVIQRPSPGRLVVTAENGTRREFVDDVVAGERRSTHRLVSAPGSLHGLVIVRQYIPEGRMVLMVDRRTGDVIELDDVPVPSPDGERFVTASLDLVAGHLPNRIRIYRMTTGGPTLEMEWQPREWGAQHATWLDAGTLQLERGMVDWNSHELITAPMVMRRTGDRWRMEPSPEHARAALLAFLSALGQGHYIEATQYYGGSYDQMRAWNPDLPPDDHATLWSHACQHNGLQCVGRAEVLNSEQLSQTDVRFTVHLLTPSGQRLALGPCCGETEESMPTQRTFAFTVRRDGERYVVLDTPPYMP